MQSEGPGGAQRLLSLACWKPRKCGGEGKQGGGRGAPVAFPDAPSEHAQRWPSAGFGVPKGNSSYPDFGAGWRGAGLAAGGAAWEGRLLGGLWCILRVSKTC